MLEFISNHELVIRLSFFLGIFTLIVVWELIAPRRALTQPRWLRWYSNIGVALLNTIVVRFLIPIAPVVLAVTTELRGWGALNFVTLPFWLDILISIVVLDLIIYLQHVMFHAVPALWRLHRMHHADLDFDVTTGARFHPGEIIVSTLIKFVAILIIGPPAVAVVIFEVLLNGSSLFNHGNLRLPLPLDRILRWIIVTPDMHRVHHSDVASETNSNFGFNLPYWDRLFGTYRDQPSRGHESMTIGLNAFCESNDLHLHKMLIQPLKRGANNYTINNRTREQE